MTTHDGTGAVDGASTVATPSFSVRSILADATIDLRLSILHPEKPRASLVYADDLQPTTWHAGAFSGRELVGVASVYVESPPGLVDRTAWRLRDMGVKELHRGHGCGRALLDACLAQIATCGGTVLWCYARPTAVPFYLAQQFVQRAGVVDLPEFGPRYLMTRPVDRSR
jgi:ribosomal protein S18 acetylase RimI-like enzyme